MPPKTVSVTGFKNSGKTRVVEALVTELTTRGYMVGTLKHTADDIVLDSPGKDTSRHREAGSVATGILQANTTALFIDKELTIPQAVEKLGEIDYLVIEGFKTVYTHPRVVVPRKNGEVPELSKKLAIAVVKTPESEFNEATDLPVIELSDAKTLADLVEEKAFKLLPGTNCKDCHHEGCWDLAQAVVRGDAKRNVCVWTSLGFSLKVNDQNIPVKKFVREAMENVVQGFIKTLKGGEKAMKVQLEFEVSDDE